MLQQCNYVLMQPNPRILQQIKYSNVLFALGDDGKYQQTLCDRLTLYNRTKSRFFQTKSTCRGYIVNPFPNDKY